MTRSRDVADTQDNLGGAVAPGTAGKNVLINSAFDIFQRSSAPTTGVTVTAGNAYTLDRWNGWTLSGGGSVIVSQQAVSDTTNLPFVSYCARFRRPTGNADGGGSFLGQPLENSDSARLIGQTVTFSFYARKGANYSPTSNVLFGQVWANTTTNASLQTLESGARTTVASVTAILTDTWQKFTCTGTVGSTMKQVAVIFYYQPTGTAGANDYFEVTGVQLELGAQSTPFARNSSNVQSELAACQRYYYRVAGGAAYQPYALGYATTSANGSFIVNYPVTMRTSPSFVDYSTIYAEQYDGVSSTAGTPTIANASAYLARINMTGMSGMTAGRAMVLYSNNNVSGYFGLSAEL